MIGLDWMCDVMLCFVKIEIKKSKPQIGGSLLSDDDDEEEDGLFGKTKKIKEEQIKEPSPKPVVKKEIKKENKTRKGMFDSDDNDDDLFGGGSKNKSKTTGLFLFLFLFFFLVGFCLLEI